MHMVKKNPQKLIYSYKKLCVIVHLFHFNIFV